MNKWMIWGEKTIIFGLTPMFVVVSKLQCLDIQRFPLSKYWIREPKNGLLSKPSKSQGGLG